MRGGLTSERHSLGAGAASPVCGSGAAALMGGGRDQDGDQDGRSSATTGLTERKGFSVCGGARTTSSYGEAGGGRRATSSYGEAAFRSVVVGNRHSMMSRTRCFGGRGPVVLLPAAVFVCTWRFLVAPLVRSWFGSHPHNKQYWPISGAPGAQLVAPRAQQGEGAARFRAAPARARRGRLSIFD